MADSGDRRGRDCVLLFRGGGIQPGSRASTRSGGSFQGITMTSIIPEYQSVIPAAPELAVHCRRVTKSYGVGAGQVTALRGIDLDVRTGELLMLVGPSGCGKTTLISCIAGILDHDEGVCTVFGHDFKSMSQGQRTRLRGRTLGFVFHSFNLLPTLTAAENVAVPLLI